MDNKKKYSKKRENIFKKHYSKSLADLELRYNQNLKLFSLRRAIIYLNKDKILPLNNHKALKKLNFQAHNNFYFGFHSACILVCQVMIEYMDSVITPYKNVSNLKIKFLNPELSKAKGHIKDLRNFVAHNIEKPFPKTTKEKDYYFINLIIDDEEDKKRNIKIKVDADEVSCLFLDKEVNSKPNFPKISNADIVSYYVLTKTRKIINAFLEFEKKNQFD